METTFIYSLKCPNTGDIRYIGKSNTPFKRINGHIAHIKKFNTRSHKNNWIKSLLKKDLKPIVEILDEVPKDDWQVYEKYWIAQFKAWGFNLTNSTIGGDGSTGYKFTEEQKEKMRKPKSTTINMRKPKSEEHKRNMSKAFKGRELSQETIDKIKKSMENNPLVIEANRRIAELHKIPVYQYDKHNILMKKWDSIREASDYNGVHESHVGDCVNNKRKTTGGYTWSKRELDESDFILKDLKTKINKLWIINREKLDLNLLMSKICKYFEIDKSDIFIKTTSRKRLTPKYYLIYFMSNILDMSFEDIDRELNTRRTSTYKNRLDINNQILFELSNKIEELI